MAVVSIVFLVILFTLLAFRFFRLPHFCSDKQVRVAQAAADDFIESYPYQNLDFTTPKVFFSAVLDLNSTIAQALGVRSSRPELNIPIGYLIHSIRSISTDLEEFFLHDSMMKHVLPFIKLYHVLWFVPKTSKPANDDLPGKRTWGAYFASFTIIRKTIFKFIFRRVAYYSINLYSGRVLEKSHLFSFRNSESSQKFFQTRLLLLPILLGIFFIVLFCGLVISGLLYSTDSAWELIQIYRNSMENGLTSVSTLPWKQIFFHTLPTLLALIFSCFFYFSLFFYHRFRLQPFQVHAVPEWPNHEHENFAKIQEFIALNVSRLSTFSSSVEVVQELLSFTDSLYRKPDAAAFSLSLSEILKAQQILISRSQAKFDEEFPFLNFFNIRDFQFANRMYAIYLKFFLFYRGLNFSVNPISGPVLETRIRINQLLLQPLLKEFLFSGKISLLNLIGFNMMEIYNGHLYFTELSHPLNVFLTGGTSEQQKSVSSALSNIPDQNFHIQIDSSQEVSYLQKWLHLRVDFDSRWKKIQEQMKQADLILFLASEKPSSSETEIFEKILAHSESLLDSLEAPPLAVLIVPSNGTSLPCSEKIHIIPWQNDEETEPQESLQTLLEQSRQQILVRQNYRFLRDYKEKHDR
ncbi:MAG: hypothetical protein K6C40_03630 [Thermoguttaceae bacterium]|nr:hypothetical protein [Thermoguttaceae bacterium]